MVVDMSRGPLRSSSEICADCSAPDPKWASINRGVLICDECCSIHRSLGRHISQVKSLKKGAWIPTRLACVHQLMNSGANNIWEYALIDPALNKQCKRKPNPRDQLHPTKADFIRKKYQFLTFTKKYKDEDIGTVTDLSKQLHSSVRTNNLETSLRLLSLGADPNFLHPERGNRALHVAAQSGQALQVELLIIYGADPGATDSTGKTPVDYARQEKHTDIGHRLVEAQYELTDALAYYLCSRKPDHANGHHFIIPEMADSVDSFELAKAARKKLQMLPNHLFEELAMDVYDEVDRRENDAIWMSTKNPNTNVSDRQAVPFLPVNPEFSSTRNQGRQKLARFNAREFATLIIDLLSDARRRQQGMSVPIDSFVGIPAAKPAMRKVKTSSFSDDEPCYDTVASDEDYSSLGDAASVKDRNMVMDQVNDETEENHVSNVITQDSCTSPVSTEYSGMEELRQALSQSQDRIEALVKVNNQLLQETANLKMMVQALTKENSELKELKAATRLPNQSDLSANIDTPMSRLTTPGYTNEDRTPSSSLLNGNPAAVTKAPVTAAAVTPAVVTLRSGGRNRPQSMIETSRSRMTAIPIDIGSNLTTTQSGSLSRLSARTKQGRQVDDIMIESDNDGSLYDNDTVVADVGTAPSFPTQEDISANTENITRRIQELLTCATKNKHDSYVPCSDRITEAVDKMINLFPLELESEAIQKALSGLKSGAMKLCQEAKTPAIEVNGAVDYRSKTQQIIQCAYDIAKTAKVLVTSVNNTQRIG